MDSISCILFLRQLHLNLNMCCFINFMLKITSFFDQEKVGTTPLLYVDIEMFGGTDVEMTSGRQNWRQNIKISILTSCTRVILHPSCKTTFPSLGRVPGNPGQVCKKIRVINRFSCTFQKTSAVSNGVAAHKPAEQKGSQSAIGTKPGEKKGPQSAIASMFAKADQKKTTTKTAKKVKKKGRKKWKIGRKMTKKVFNLPLTESCLIRWTYLSLCMRKKTSVLCSLRSFRLNCWWIWS